MINKDRWVNSLPNVNSKHNQELSQIDHNKWVNTIAKKNAYIPKKNAYNSVKKIFINDNNICL